MEHVVIFKFIVFGICWRYCYSQCWFPLELSGSWISSHRGHLNFNSTTVTGYTIPADTCENPCPQSMECFMKLNSTYLLRSPIFISGKLPLRMYVCWDITEMSSSKVIYYPAIEGINTFINDRAVFLQTEPDSVESVCDRTTPYSPQSYNILLKNESPLKGITNCPNVILGRFTEDQSNCSVDLNSCTDKTSLSISSNNCSSAPFFSSNGTLRCIHSILNDNTTYITVYNEDNTVDNIHSFQFTCLNARMVSEKLFISENPVECYDNQTSTVTPTNGRSYKFTALELCPITNSTADVPSLTTVEIAGLSFGSLLLLLLLILLLLCCFYLGKYKKGKHREFDLEKGAGRSRNDADEVRLIRANKGEKDADDTSSSDSGLGGGGYYKKSKLDQNGVDSYGHVIDVHGEGSGHHEDNVQNGSGRRRKEDSFLSIDDSNRMKENIVLSQDGGGRCQGRSELTTEGSDMTREGSSIYKDTTEGNTNITKLLTSTRYGKVRQLVTDEHGRHVLLEMGGTDHDDLDNHSWKGEMLSRSSSADRGILDTTNLSSHSETNPSKMEDTMYQQEDTFSNNMLEAECKRENSFYMFQPDMPIKGRLTTRKKEEKRHQVEKPEKTRQGVFKLLAKHLKKNSVQNGIKEPEQYKQQGTHTPPNQLPQSLVDENKTPYLEEYYYKKAVEQYLEDEGFFDDSDSKKRVLDIFNFHDDNPIINPNYKKDHEDDSTNIISSTQISRCSSRCLDEKPIYINGERSLKKRVLSVDVEVTKHDMPDEVNHDQDFINRTRKHGTTHLPPPSINLTMDSGLIHRSSTPEGDLGVATVKSSDNPNGPRQSRVIFVEECSDSDSVVATEKSPLSVTPRFPDLRLQLPPLRERKESHNSSPPKASFSWSRSSYDDLHNCSSPRSRLGSTSRSDNGASRIHTITSGLGGYPVAANNACTLPHDITSPYNNTSRPLNSGYYGDGWLEAWLDTEPYNNQQQLYKKDYPAWLSKGKSHRAFIEEHNKKMAEQSPLFSRVPVPQNLRDMDGLLSPRVESERQRRITTGSLTDWYISVTPTSARLNYPVMDKIRLKKWLEELYIDKKYLNRLTDQTDNAKDESEKSAHQLSADCSDYLLRMARYWELHPPLPPIPPATEIGVKLQRASTTQPASDDLDLLYFNPKLRSKSNC